MSLPYVTCFSNAHAYLFTISSNIKQHDWGF